MIKILFFNDLTSGLWKTEDVVGNMLEQGEFHSLEELSELMEEHPQARAYLSGEQVLLLDVDLPTKQARQIAKALPFALEEQLATDVDRNHILYLGRDNGRACAAVVEHALMEKVSEAMPLECLVPVPMALPLKKDEWTLYLTEDRAYLRTGPYSGLTCPSPAVSLFVDRQLPEDPSTVNLTVYTEDLDSHQLVIAQLENHGINVSSSEIDQVWTLLEDTTPKHVANLLVDSYKPVTPKKERKASFLAPITGLAAAAFVLGVSINVWQGKMNSHLASEVKSASIGFYKQLFPNERIRNMKRQFQSKLKGSEGSVDTSGFTASLGLIGDALKSNKDFASIEFANIRFNEKKGGLDIDLTASSIAQLESYKKMLTNKGFAVEITSATNENSKIKGHIKVVQNG